MSRIKNLNSLKGLSGELHLWLGVLSSFFVVLICFSGTLLILEKPVKQWVNHDLQHIEEGEVVVSADTALDRYRDEFSLPVRKLIIPNQSDRAWTLTGSHESEGDSLTVYFNPYTAEFTGQPRVFTEVVFDFLLSLHTTLLLSTPGRILVTISTIIFVILLLTGLVLWWPRRWKAMKRGLNINFKSSFKSLNYQLHNVLGFYALLLLLLMGISGLYIAQDWVRNGMDSLLGGEDKNAQYVVPDELKNQEGSGYQDLLQDAHDILPYKALTVIEFPDEKESKGVIIKYRTIEPAGIRVTDRLYYDPNFLQISGYDFFEADSRAGKYSKLNLALHTGEILGWPTMLLYFLASILGTSLPVTGLLVWLNKFRREPYGKNRLETPEKRKIAPQKAKVPSDRSTD